MRCGPWPTACWTAHSSSPSMRAAAAVRLLAERNRTVAEGAGAVSVAAALAGKAGGGKIACIVSGGNLDPQKLASILTGRTP